MAVCKPVKKKAAKKKPLKRATNKAAPKIIFTVPGMGKGIAASKRVEPNGPRGKKAIRAKNGTWSYY